MFNITIYSKKDYRHPLGGKDYRHFTAITATLFGESSYLELNQCFNYRQGLPPLPKKITAIFYRHTPLLGGGGKDVMGFGWIAKTQLNF